MSNSNDTVKNILAPYRKRIDDLDKDLVDMLVKRFKIIAEVSEIKEKYSIPAILPDRVDEVRNRAANMAEAKGLDYQFVHDLYTMMIDYACKLEDKLMSEK